MGATENQIARLRRMVDEPTEANYTNDDLRYTIESYPLVDERGVEPYWYDTSTNPPTQVATRGWYPTYDLHAAAADIWEEKAAAVADEYDYPGAESPTGINGVARNSQVYDHYKKQARHHAARRTATTAKLMPWPGRNRRGDSIIGNLPEVEP
jgi:hypothetical protein